MTKIVGSLFKVTNVLFVLLYLSACLIPVLPAGKYWMIAILGLAFPLLFLIVTGFLVCWIIARSRWSFLPLIALLLSWQQLSVIAGLNSKKEFTYSKSNETLRIFSWNVSSWGETNKSRTPKFNYGPLTINLIKKQQADVLCFQEFWDKKSRKTIFSWRMELEEMGYKYSYFVKTSIDSRLIKTGVAIISKYPIIDSAKFSYGEDDFAENLIYVDILFNHQKIRVFTTHLQSVRLESEEYQAIRKIKQSDESGLKDSKTIARKLKNAYSFRGDQADLVHQKIIESPYPVIICGDFNDVPNSYTYFTIKGDLNDAFLDKGTGLGRTFQYLSPTLRIDYILSDKKFEVKQFNRIKVPYSDHYPITADFHLPSNSKHPL